jgi:predicted DNA-binding protein (MmcQ/YjbR family)
MNAALKRVAKALHAHALGLPEAWEDSPWGDSVVKVGKKIFVFLSPLDQPDPTWSLSVKLPVSSAEALATTTSSPTGYGLGRAGWVTITLAGTPQPDIDLLKDWIEESYRAVAPKKLARLLDGPA